MHKFIVIILLNFLDICLYSNTNRQITSLTDWENGQVTAIDKYRRIGEITLLASNGIQTDEFESLKFFWNLAPLAAYGGTAFIVSGEILRLAGSSSNAMEQCIKSPSYSCPENITIETYIEADCASCVRGGIKVDFGVASFHVGIQSTNSLFIAKNGNAVFSQPGIGHGHFMIEKNTSAVYVRHKMNLTDPWQQYYYSDLAGTAATIQISLGSLTNYPVSQYHYLKITPYQSTGSWYSNPIDLSSTPTTSGQITWNADVPLGSDLGIYSSSSPDTTNWSNWEGPYSNGAGSRLVSPPARYIRLGAILKADPSGKLSPILREINVAYDDATPTAPVLNSSTHSYGRWRNRNIADLTWAVPAGNPAPESRYRYWLDGPAGVTEGSGVVALAASGTAHPFSVTLTAEGVYSLALSVTAEPFSGGLSAMSQAYDLRYDGTAPGETLITSPTHPQLLFSNNNSPLFKLSALDSLSGVSGYAVVLDKAPISDPGVLANQHEEVRYALLENGTWYLHARAVDMAGNTGQVAHYGIRVDYKGALVAEEFVKALPNPVRTDTAHLQYELAAPALELKLEFLNAQGELLKTVEGGRGVGKNSYDWDVAGLANGVYYFRVKAKSSEDGKAYVVTRKVAVIR